MPICFGKCFGSMTINIELNHKAKNGLYLILIRVTHNRKHTRISSEIYVKKTDFRKKAKWLTWVKETHLDASKLNKQLEDKIKKIRDHYEKYQTASPSVAVHGSSFFKYAEDYIERFNNKDNIGTYKIYNSKLNKLKAYGGDKLTFSDINVQFLRSYVIHLKKKKDVIVKGKAVKIGGNSTNTVSVDLRKIRAIFNQAAKEDVIEYSQNPFRKIKIEVTRTRKEKLNAEELNAIRALDLSEGEPSWHTRNIFLFCINCMGMRVGSALKLKSNQVKDGVLYYQMSKGGKNKNIRLNDEAQKIIDLYPDRGVYLFPYLERYADNEYLGVSRATAIMNAALKRIAESAGIDKHITTHVARHTLTKMAIDSGIDMRTLQGILDHSSVQTTEDYAGDISDEQSNEAMDKIFKKK